MPSVPPNADSKFCNSPEQLKLLSVKAVLVRNFYGMKMTVSLALFRGAGILGFFLLGFSSSSAATPLTLPAETPAILEKIYSFDLDGAQEAARQLQKTRPDHPIGYLLESGGIRSRLRGTRAGVKVGNERSPPPFETSRRPALPRTSNHRLFPCCYSDSKGRLRRDAALRWHGRRCIRAPLRFAR